MAEQLAPTRYKTPRLLTRLRCGLQTRLLCTSGLSCKPSSSSESTSELPRRRADSKLSSGIEAVSDDRKRLRSCDRKSSSSDDVITCTDSGVGRSLDSDSRATSGCHTSGSPTYDVIGRRRKRRCTRLSTVDELVAPEPEAAVTWSRERVTGNDVIESPMTTRRRRKVPELREQLYSSCSHFRGECMICSLIFTRCLWLSQLSTIRRIAGVSPLI